MIAPIINIQHTTPTAEPTIIAVIESFDDESTAFDMIESVFDVVFGVEMNVVPSILVLVEDGNDDDVVELDADDDDDDIVEEDKLFVLSTIEDDNIVDGGGVTATTVVSSTLVTISAGNGR